MEDRRSPSSDDWETATGELTGTNLGGTNLGGANLGGSNLGGSNLGGANLGGTNLGGSNLGGTNLGGTNLGGNNLGGNNLGGTNLGGTNLGGTNLGGTNLGGTNLGGSNLGGTNLAGVNLGTGTPIAGSKLVGATLSTAGIGVNIHSLGNATAMLNSGEDLFTRTSSCMVMGFGSRAFAKLVADNPTGTMYTALKKLPWGFSTTSGGALGLNAWEAVVWGGSKYCVFIIAAPTDATFAGVAGYVKAVWRWTAPPTRTMSIGQIGGGQTIASYTGMMDAGAQLLAGPLLDRAFLAGEFVFVGATTNDVSVQVDFASWVAKEMVGNDPLILGRVTDAPLHQDAVYTAMFDARADKVWAIIQSFDSGHLYNDAWEELNRAYYSYQAGVTSKPVAKRCFGAFWLYKLNSTAFPLPTAKCDAFSLEAMNTNYLYQDIPRNGTRWNSSPFQYEYELQSESPDGRRNFTIGVPAGTYGCDATHPTWSFNSCNYPILSQTYVSLNEPAFTVDGSGNGQGLTISITRPGQYQSRVGALEMLTVQVTNVGTTPTAAGTVLVLAGSYSSASPSSPVDIGGLAPGATSSYSWSFVVGGLPGSSYIRVDAKKGTTLVAQSGRALTVY